MNKVERLQAAAIAAPGIRDTRPARKVHVWNPTTGQVVGTLNSREVAKKVAERAKIELGTETLKKISECESCGLPYRKKRHTQVLCPTCRNSRVCVGYNKKTSWKCERVLSPGRRGWFCTCCLRYKKTGDFQPPRICFQKKQCLDCPTLIPSSKGKRCPKCKSRRQRENFKKCTPATHSKNA